jgi:putative ABC transport system permease protein
MVAKGLVARLADGIACGRLTESLLFEIKATGPSTVAAPLLTLLGAALAATLPPAIRATRIDPAQTLRSEYTIVTATDA